MNSISSRPHLMDLKNVVAADVALATCQIEQSRKLVDLSYVLKRVGRASISSFVIAKMTLAYVSYTFMIDIPSPKQHTF